MARQRAERARISAMTNAEYVAFCDDLDQKRAMKWEAVVERDRMCEEHPDSADFYRSVSLSFFRDGADAADEYDRAAGYDLDTGASSGEDEGDDESDGASSDAEGGIAGGEGDPLADAAADAAAAPAASGDVGSDGECVEEGEEWEWGSEEDDDEAFFAATAGC